MRQGTNFYSGVETNIENNPRLTPWYHVNKNDPMLWSYLNEQANFLEKEMQCFWGDANNKINFYNVDMPRSRWNVQGESFKHNVTKSWNLLRVVVDGHFNRIVRVRPRPTFLTKGAETSIKQMAVDADDFTLHQFKAGKYFRKGAFAFKDACLIDVGAVKIFPSRTRENGLDIKRANPMFISVQAPYEGDENRSEVCETGCYHLSDIIDAVLDNKKTSKMEKMKILNSLKTEFNFGSNYYNTNQMVTVRELHKALYKRALFTKQTVIEFEDWPYSWTPYVFVRWDSRQTGIIGTGPRKFSRADAKKNQWIVV